jgi:hypothetical protein
MPIEALWRRCNTKANSQEIHRGMGRALIFWDRDCGTITSIVHPLALAAGRASFAASRYLKTEHEKYLERCARRERELAEADRNPQRKTESAEITLCFSAPDDVAGHGAPQSKPFNGEDNIGDSDNPRRANDKAGNQQGTL